MAVINKIAELLATGWIIDQIQFDQFQNFYYVGARHETGEVESVEGCGESLTFAIDMMHHKAISSTPQWYLDQLRTRKS